MAKKPEPAPKRKLTDPEFDHYDCRPEPKEPPTAAVIEREREFMRKMGVEPKD